MKSPRCNSSKPRKISERHGRRIALILAAVCFLAAPAPAQEPLNPVSYVLALSWQPAFCAVRTTDPACAEMLADQWAGGHFTLHGLWPNVDRNYDGRVNADDNYCLPASERAVAIDSKWRRLPEPDLSTATRQELERVMPGTESLLERYQWIKHGTCSGFDPDRYFAAAIARTDDVADTEFSRFVALNIGRQVSRRDLIDRFELDFGKGSGRALRLFCTRPEGMPILAEIRLILRPNRIELPLTRGSLAIPAVPAAGTCPTKFRIETAN
jgi:ribonuclease T2